MSARSAASFTVMFASFTATTSGGTSCAGNTRRHSRRHMHTRTRCAPACLRQQPQRRGGAELREPLRGADG